MTGMELFAFVILPISMAGLGWAAGLIFERYDRRNSRKRHAAE